MLQDVYLTVWRKASFFDPSRAAVSAWIFAIARNLRIDRLRRDQRAKLHEVYELPALVMNAAMLRKTIGNTTESARSTPISSFNRNADG